MIMCKVCYIKITKCTVLHRIFGHLTQVSLISLNHLNMAAVAVMKSQCLSFKTEERRLIIHQNCEWKKLKVRTPLGFHPPREHDGDKQLNSSFGLSLSFLNTHGDLSMNATSLLPPANPSPPLTVASVRSALSFDTGCTGALTWCSPRPLAENCWKSSFFLFF